MPVGFNTLLSEIDIELDLLQLFEYAEVNWYLVEPDD